MRGKTFQRLFLCLLAAALLMAPGMRAEAAKSKKAAAKALNEAYATSAKSVLLDAATVSYTAVLPGVPASDDGILYLYELQPYEYTISPAAVPVSAIPATASPAFTLPYNGARLYTKLALAVKSGGQNVMIASPQYIANPELLAAHTRARQTRALNSIQGVQFANLLVSNNLNGIIAGKYTTIQIMNQGTNQGITNPWSRTGMFAADTHPTAPQYYMLNASEPAGITALAAELSKCAASSSAENFIIGNEVNVRKWNYMIWTDWDHYVREYSQVFRVAYNAIKSQNANARVFVCLDQNWDRNRPSSHAEYYEYIDGKDFLEKFNALISKEGNIDWNVAQHPYPVPLTWAKFWDLNGCPDGAYMKAQVASNKMLTFQNLSALTDFLQTKKLRSPSGAVRHVILSEIGITNAQGVDVQAAALYASYVAARNNPYVDEIIYTQSFSEAMLDTRFSGVSQSVYASLGTPAEANYDAWAKAFIGITDWSQVLR